MSDPSFDEVTESHLPRRLASVGDLEVGDVDGDGDLDIVLADWGPGNNMTNNGGRTILWLNEGSGRFIDATSDRMPETLVRFSWDLELVDVGQRPRPRHPRLVQAVRWGESVSERP